MNLKLLPLYSNLWKNANAKESRRNISGAASSLLPYLMNAKAAPWVQFSCSEVVRTARNELINRIFIISQYYNLPSPARPRAAVTSASAVHVLGKQAKDVFSGRQSQEEAVLVGSNFPPQSKSQMFPAPETPPPLPVSGSAPSARRGRGSRGGRKARRHEQLPQDLSLSPQVLPIRTDSN